MKIQINGVTGEFTPVVLVLPIPIGIFRVEVARDCLTNSGIDAIIGTQACGFGVLEGVLSAGI